MKENYKEKRTDKSKMKKKIVKSGEKKKKRESRKTRECLKKCPEKFWKRKLTYNFIG